MGKYKFIVLICLGYFGLLAQEKPKENPFASDYYWKEEIIYNNNRYRIHNSYLTLGAGFLQSNIRKSLQRKIGIDFQFPIKRLHFQAGVMMSGETFGSNNNIQGHIGYGLRQEKNKSNLAAYIGPSYHTGVTVDATNNPVFYQGWGVYACVQAVNKFSYDIGLGAELFTDISRTQRIVGLKLIAFFSGAYRGPKKNYNPHVRSENPS
jgi:hypothetical protein